MMNLAITTRDGACRCHDGCGMKDHVESRNRVLRVLLSQAVTNPKKDYFLRMRKINHWIELIPKGERIGERDEMWIERGAK